jgi:Tol biopolymer transport system component
MRRYASAAIIATLAVTLGPGAGIVVAPSARATGTTILDTLGTATPGTTFSVFGSGGVVVSSSQVVGPRFTLAERTTITEIGGFVNNCASIVGGVPQCPGTLPFTVQIRPSLSGAPDPSSVLATLVLSHDDDPLVISYESVSTNVTLDAGTYFALFAPQDDDAGGLMGSASSPFDYQAGLTNLGFLDPTTGSSSNSDEFAAVRVLGHHAPPLNGRIVFTSEDGPDTDIFTIQPDGTGLVNLTPDGAGFDNYPSWSPDGSKIAFTSGRDGDPEIYVMNADGSGVRRLTTSPGRDIRASWSPDGTKIVFASTRTGDLEIFTMNADGTSVQQLTFEPENSGPKYSPDGTQIAFTGIRGTTSAVYTIPANGGSSTKLTPDSLNAGYPDWSPDGSHLLFVNNVTVNAASNIFTMQSDGTGIVRLTQRSENEVDPNWSPDGTKIDFWTFPLFPAADKAFDFGFQGSNRLLSAKMAGDIWLMNADGTGFSDVTNSPGQGDRHPDWGTNLS